MSIEYFAQIHSITKNQISRIRELLNLNTTIELFDKQNENRIDLRFLDIPKRETWPEDATISFDGSSVCLSFHSSTKDKRELLIKDITGLLTDLGFPCDFEEE